MANHSDHRPLPELVGGLLTDISGLFRKEIDLAKAEASEKMDRALGGLELLAIGLVFAIGAIGVLLSAAVTGLAAFLVSQGMTGPNANALSAVIVGVIVAILAWAMISRGIGALRSNNLSLDRTATSLRQDAEVIRGDRL
ncbi:phage holin family protein [Mycoplana dimorpha]|jgi:TM2 domain-containing membrane protein YozV|uniref:Putative superfamily III holin-X n=1 Tax=Mycoplana dimorpha TaxID=28320 RepID=A0A2T5B843_MYCDI|nr:phage holin family protein [Mycoplana dimorpha]PTM95127.1 putative superfamily III holin-X [Mycoplana dimorpha]